MFFSSKWSALCFKSIDCNRVSVWCNSTDYAAVLEFRKFVLKTKFCADDRINGLLVINTFEHPHYSRRVLFKPVITN